MLYTLNPRLTFEHIKGGEVPKPEAEEPDYPDDAVDAPEGAGDVPGADDLPF
jgi:hypothetical protein